MKCYSVNLFCFIFLRTAKMKLLFAMLIITSFSTRLIAIEPQKAMNWCWAACVQDVLAQANIRQTQEQISQRLDGWPRDRPATSQELVILLRSYGLGADQAGRPGTPLELYGSLNSGAKLIAFVRPSDGPVGHFLVIQGFDPTDNALKVSDPATGNTFRESPVALYNAWRWGDSVIVRTSAGNAPLVGVPPRLIQVPCRHPLHPNGDLIPCQHGPLHMQGDIILCQHPVFTPYGPRPAHPNGDLIPCQHGLRHPNGDLVPCQHMAHPDGHMVPSAE